MKFELLLELARERGFDCLATGHYARITRVAASGRLQLRKARDESKDQSYVLYMLTQEQLAHLRFPLGELSKAEVRAIAESAGLVTASKRESQDICFIPDGDYGAFLERRTGRRDRRARACGLFSIGRSGRSHPARPSFSTTAIWSSAAVRSRINNRKP